jgi:LemA protein
MDKQKQKYLIYAVVGFIVLSFFWYQSTKNRIIVMHESIESSWAQVENQLQRRYDLIPNLVNSVKGYTKHEKEIFTQIAESRAKLSGAQNIQDKVKASNGLEGALSRLLMVVERYPNLKANTNFQRLMDELAGTENRLSVERRRYNENVKIFNQTILKFPYKSLAKNAGFTKASYFKVNAAVKANPKVSF